MQITDFRSRLLPHIVNIGLFLVITVAYFSPVLEGKKLLTHDNSVYLNSSHEISEHREKYGEEPLWTNSMFGGMPAYLISTLYPGNLIRYVDGFLKIFKIPVAAIFLTMIGFYILLLFYGLNPWIAGAGALAYSLSSYLFIILGAGHNTKAFAIAYMAPLIGSIIFSYRRNAVYGALFMAWFLTLQIMANHLQITYYALIAVGIFGITELVFAFREKKIVHFLKTTALLIIPLIIAVSVNFASMITTLEYGKYSMRGKSELTAPAGQKDKGLEIGYATQWSYGIDETMTLVIPGFKGGASKPFPRDSHTFEALRQNNAAQAINQLPMYWGTQPSTDGPVYVGAIVFFLFIFGLFVLKGPDKWWLLAATILSFLLSWGKNFMWFTELFMNIVPGYNKFRAVSMTLVIAEFCIPLLGFLALHAVVSGKVEKKEVVKGLKGAVAVTGGLMMLFILFPGLSGSFLSSFEEGQIPAWLSSAMVTDRKEMLRNDAFRSLVFALLSAVLIFYYVRGKITMKALVPALIFLIVVDMWPVSKRYMNNEKFVAVGQFSRSFITSEADKMILDDPEINRVLNLSVSTFNDASTSYHHHSIGGYHGAKMRRYQELIDSVMGMEIQTFGAALQTAQSEADIDPALQRLTALNMLNTKYIIYSPDAPPLRNPYAKGNAWFADTIIVVKDSNEELQRLPELVKGGALMTSEYSAKMKLTGPVVKGSDNSLELVSYKPNELIYRANIETNSIAIFSEIHYPAGWRAYINDVETPILRANYILRAIEVPTGKHVIKFVFRPDSYFMGNRVSLAGSVLLILISAGFAFMAFNKRGKTE